MVSLQAPAPTQVALIWKQALGLQVSLTRSQPCFLFICSLKPGGQAGVQALISLPVHQVSETGRSL